MSQAIYSITTLIWLVFCCISQAWASNTENQETYTYQLTRSNEDFAVWTTPPSERVFKNDSVPETASSRVLLYAAKNEFEPFQVVVKPGVSGNVTVTMGEFGSGIKAEIHRVKYVNIAEATDILGKTGDYPDPLWPVKNGSSVSLTANENTAFWITVYIPATVAGGEYTADFQINSATAPLSPVTVPVSLHVFNFTIPDEIHTKSMMNVSHNAILDKYGVPCCGDEYWMYVDKIKQFFIDHRLTPKGVLWSGGLTSNGGGPYIDYDCTAGTFTDNDGIWGFEEPAQRYLDGSGLMNGTFGQSFNNGTGFPSFMAATFQNNDASKDQRPSAFCGETKTASDWYTADDPDSPYNTKWFDYMAAMEKYLSDNDYLGKAYYYMANEPQDQADYDAVAWYSQELKKAAPNLKLMVSEEAKPEIYDHASFPGAKIDIWLPVLNNYDPETAHARESQFNEETWIYWLHGTRPPYFNPVTLDHPGIESKFTGWFLWKYRVRGIAYYSLNSWSKNPWTDPLNDGHNGDLFMLYPPSQSNSPIAYGANGHEFVSSIRFELMRDSLEDYEYLYVLNEKKQPVVNSANPSDTQAGKIITGLASYTRDSNFMYNLRRLIGLKNGGEIADIPDIEPSASHPRSAGTPGNYYINFQNPDETFSTQPYGNPTMKDEVMDNVTFRMLDYDGKTYYAAGAQAYDDDKGYGWFGNIINQPGQTRDPWGTETDERKRTYIYDDYGRVNTFEFALPNGEYDVLLCVGTPRKNYTHNNVKIEGILFVDDERNDYFIERSKTVSVSDNSLTLETGLTGMDEYTMLNYLHIEAKDTMEPPPSELDIDKPDTHAILTDTSPDVTAASGVVTHIFGTSGANHVTVQKEAWAKLLNFPGANHITIESDSSLFSVSRSGATVTFEGSDRTMLVLPATQSHQTILFSTDNKTLDLVIESNSVMLNDESI
ncbi:MAG: DUF4091 domain-containing protein [Desulfobacteraceae bacterium]|nr:DUF4091 domain-containing protein [Desulfobacteraceae bacterium]